MSNSDLEEEDRLLFKQNPIICAGEPWRYPLLTETVLVDFVTYCHSVLGIAYTSIKTGIRFFYIRAGRGNPLWSPEGVPLPRLEYILKGIKRQQAHPARQRLPITVDILDHMCRSLHQGCFTPFVDSLMLAVVCLAFLGFLRCGEFTVRGSFDCDSNLCRNDVVLAEDNSFMERTLRSSKTDPYRRGVKIVVFDNERFQHVHAMSQYLRLRASIPRPSPALFVTQEGYPLTREFFLHKLQVLLNRLSYRSSDFNGHSFRIGAATTAAANFVDDHLIQTLGRWSSMAYTRYIHTSLDTLKAAQLAMCQY
ncbi:uncharacterized protein LOC124267514 [Haliotis rubra]|uniref:uncharacterized protein LOC124267514 n=1 Tax=Haliotis rubra TaxID=36100 RepID=UPI001EE5FF59|nr:uncharacterized protein LOC124267514 [Haliotis rubra]